MLSGSLLSAIVGTGDISSVLIRVADNVTQMRVSTMAELVTSIGIVILAVLLYLVLQRQNRIIAFIALGLWLAEAIILAVSKIGAFALIPLSLEFVAVGAPEASHFQTLGALLYNGVDRTGNDIHMLFYGVGGILWFYLFYRSKFMPRILSLRGMVAETIALIGMIFLLCGIDVNILFFAQIAALELVVGLWLLIKGIKERPAS